MTVLKSKSCNPLRLIIPFLEAMRINLCHLFKLLDSEAFFALNNKSLVSLFHLPAISRDLIFCYLS